MHSCQFERCSRRVSLFSFLFAMSVGASSLFVLAGCQKSQTEDSAVVSPPEPGVTQESTGSSGPPGSIELPPDADINGEPATPAVSPPAPAGLEMPKGIEPTDTGSNDSKSEIRYATWQQIEQTATSTGKITVVDLWSLVCEPCIKEFPGLVRLHQQFGDRVQCIAVDVDFDGRKTRPPETYEERVTSFIDSVGAKFPTYISRTPSDDVYAANQLASIPAVLIYDADGKLVQIFEDAGDTAGFTYEKDIAPLVKKLAG